MVDIECGHRPSVREQPFAHATRLLSSTQFTSVVLARPLLVIRRYRRALRTILDTGLIFALAGETASGRIAPSILSRTNASPHA